MSITAALRARVRQQAGDRCGYCRSHQDYVYALLEMDHIVPSAAGGTDDEENLWLACRLCNQYKGTQVYARDPQTGRRVRLFNPRRQSWSRHFEWDGPHVIGRTACGRATIHALQLNNDSAVKVRVNWMAAGWHPPTDE